MFLPSLSLSLQREKFNKKKRRAREHTRATDRVRGRWVGGDGFECSSPLSTRDYLPPKRFVAVSSTQSDSLLDDDENENEEDFKQGGKM